jgi:hypothetical protein
MSKRTNRQARPHLESLEGRQLLSTFLGTVHPHTPAGEVHAAAIKLPTIKLPKLPPIKIPGLPGTPPIKPLPPASPIVRPGPEILSGKVYVVNGERVAFTAYRLDGIDFYNLDAVKRGVQKVLDRGGATHAVSDNSSNPVRYRWTLPSNTSKNSSAVLFLIERNLDENKYRWLALRNSSGSWYLRNGQNPGDVVRIDENQTKTRVFEDNGIDITMTVINPKDNPKSGVSKNDIWYSFQRSR